MILVESRPRVAPNDSIKPSFARVGLAVAGSLASRRITEEEQAGKQADNDCIPLESKEVCTIFPTLCRAATISTSAYVARCVLSLRCDPAICP